MYEFNKLINFDFVGTIKIRFMEFISGNIHIRKIIQMNGIRIVSLTVPPNKPIFESVCSA